MSKKFRKKFGDAEITNQQMREFLQHPGATDENGNLIYFTEQHHKKECDVNLIIKKYDKTGLINHVAKFEGKFGDLTGMEFKEMQDKIANAKTMFEELPAEIKKEFDNTPEKLLSFMEHDENRDRAIELGLINADWTEETDGLGEHVLEDEHKKKKEPEKSTTE